ncbi:MAG: DUF2157 domain-containing protein [Dethiobacter sp.]|jgi:uncharacterized membrane protein|nr:DUF2157 domain-containing protein [Dethiobacter sp.]
MAEPQKKVPRRWFKWLGDEVADWKSAGIIDDNQAGAILSRYEESAHGEEPDRGGRLIATIAVLGSLLLGIGVIIFFASNWQVLPKWFKVALIISSIIAAYATGYWLAFERKTYPRVGQALILLGAILYGSGIWLIAQIFHINAHYPNGILFWSLGIIPVAVAAGSIPILVGSSLLLTLWTIFEQGQFGSTNLIYLPLSAVVLALSYRLKSRTAAGFSLLGLVIWVAIATGVSFRGEEAILYIFLLTAISGLLIFALGRLQVSWSRLPMMKTPYRIVGLLVFFLSLYLLTFSGLMRVFRYNSSAADSVFFMVAFGIITAFAVMSGGLILTKAKNDLREQKGLSVEAALVLTVAVVLVILALLGPAAGRTTLLLTTNILLFFAIVTVIISGYLGREAALINIGLVFFVLDIIARYFDFFWDMLDKSLFFMGGGLLLLAGGFLLERNRRKIISEMKVKIYEA